MELKDFVSRALCDIFNGMKDAQQKTKPGTATPRVADSYLRVEAGIKNLSPIGFEEIVTVGKRSGGGAKLSIVAAFGGSRAKCESGSNTGHAAAPQGK